MPTCCPSACPQYQRGAVPTYGSREESYARHGLPGGMVYADRFPVVGQFIIYSRGLAPIALKGSDLIRPSLRCHSSPPANTTFRSKRAKYRRSLCLNTARSWRAGTGSEVFHGGERRRFSFNARDAQDAGTGNSTSGEAPWQYVTHTGPQQ